MVKLIEYLVFKGRSMMQAQLNGKLMNQLTIFFITIVMLQFVADITGGLRKI